MRPVLLLILALPVFGGAANAQPTRLTDTQMNEVVAGHLPVVDPPVGRFPPHVPVSPPPVNSHPWNPGGPILISCTVGVGCTTTPYR
jgi:hypothetical protein